MEKIQLSAKSLLTLLEKSEGEKTINEWLSEAVKKAVLKADGADYLSKSWPSTLYGRLPQSDRVVNANQAIIALSEIIGSETDVELEEARPKTFLGDGSSLQPVKVESAQLPLHFDFLPLLRSFSIGQSGIMEAASSLEKGFFIDLYKWAAALLDVIFDLHEIRQGMGLMTLRRYKIPVEAKSKPCDWKGFTEFLCRFALPQTRWDIKIEADTVSPGYWNIICPQLAEALKEA